MVAWLLFPLPLISIYIYTHIATKMFPGCLETSIKKIETSRNTMMFAKKIETSRNVYNILMLDGYTYNISLYYPGCFQDPIRTPSRQISSIAETQGPQSRLPQRIGGDVQQLLSPVNCAGNV